MVDVLMIDAPTSTLSAPPPSSPPPPWPSSPPPGSSNVVSEPETSNQKGILFNEFIISWASNDTYTRINGTPEVRQLKLKKALNHTSIESIIHKSVFVEHLKDTLKQEFAALLTEPKLQTFDASVPSSEFRDIDLSSVKKKAPVWSSILTTLIANERFHRPSYLSEPNTEIQGQRIYMITMVVYNNFNFKKIIRDESLGYTEGIKNLTTAILILCPELPLLGFKQAMYNPTIPLDFRDILDFTGLAADPFFCQIKCIPVNKTKYWQLSDIHTNKGTIDGTYKVHNNIFKTQLAFSKLSESIPFDYTIDLKLVHNDQLTTAHIRAIKVQQSESIDPYEHKE
ncbi:hypothetical protein BOTCAL_1824g00010 [Botryotinia calthae]|uniref:DUF6589 domain-containing protein n=1 Tax=Botryotinia calthae TaxID=38488 RepID=A0A4Y8CAD5_9HELO|nr:hypothetical protein BOTCAL_1824g00010 [Botryotinia calthae]